VNTSASAVQGDKGGAPVERRPGPGDPERIGNFQIIGLLGAGGMGEVYLGVAGGRYAAVKRIRPQLVSPERFEREVAILHRVPRGVAPRLLAHDSTVERPWFATEYVPGLTLEQAVQGSGPLPADALWLLLARTAAHLQEIHKLGMVHRDLKPANVMLVPDDVRLIDFGIALDGDMERVTRDGAGCGTAGFKAPEQHGDGPVTAAADVYALGATLVCAASGSAPGPESRPDLRPLRHVDAALAALAQQCLAAYPPARPDADQLIKVARGRELAGYLCWPQEVTRRIAAREDFARRPPITTIPPEFGPGPVRKEVEPGRVRPEPGPVPGLSPGEPVMRLRSTMLTVGVTVGIVSAIVTGVVYGVAALLESGLAAGLRAALVHGTVNGIGAGLTFGLMHGLVARFTAARPVPGLSRPSAASRLAALVLMIVTGLVVGAGYWLALGSVPALAAGLMVAVGTGAMTAWGRWLILARVWPALSRR
jgi:predicted Ser/Thr protein kinase